MFAEIEGAMLFVLYAPEFEVVLPWDVYCEGCERGEGAGGCWKSCAGEMN